MSQDRIELSAGFHFAVAVTAVYRLVATGLKRYFGGFAALSTCSWEHLTPTAGTAAGTLRLPGLSARGTPLGLIGIALGLEKLLLLSAEVKGSSAIGTLNGLVLKSHWMTSSL
jgi:hypothetical protein